jgi:hypothetical protein
VRYQSEHRLEAFNGGLGRTGRVHDEAACHRTATRTRECAERTRRSHELVKARRFSLENLQRPFRGQVAGGETRTSSRHDETREPQSHRP